MALPHLGQIWLSVTIGEILGEGCVVAAVTRDCCCVFLIMAVNSEPSIRSMFLPSAKDFASCVKTPEVTTNPPASPPAAMTPYNSRMVVTPTLNAFHCLH